MFYRRIIGAISYYLEGWVEISISGLGKTGSIRRFGVNSSMFPDNDSEAAETDW